MVTYAVGKPVRTKAMIYKKSQNVRIHNPNDVLVDPLPIGTLGRIHSAHERGDGFSGWLYEERWSKTIQVDIPQQMLGTLLEPHQHNMFPHFAR